MYNTDYGRVLETIDFSLIEKRLSNMKIKQIIYFREEEMSFYQGRRLRIQKTTPKRFRLELNNIKRIE